MLLSLRSVSNLLSKRNKYELVSSNCFTPTAQPHAFAHLCLWAKQHPTVQSALRLTSCLTAFMFSSVVQLSARISANPRKPGFLYYKENLDRWGTSREVERSIKVNQSAAPTTMCQSGTKFRGYNFQLCFMQKLVVNYQSGVLCWFC